MQVYHADLLAAVLADRLALNGTAHIALSVRQQVSDLNLLRDACVCCDRHSTILLGVQF